MGESNRASLLHRSALGSVTQNTAARIRVKNQCLRSDVHAAVALSRGPIGVDRHTKRGTQKAQLRVPLKTLFATYVSL